MADRPRSAVASAPRWHLLETEPLPGAVNMAIDQTLLESVQAGSEPTLRLFRWDPACLSLGRNQPARGIYEAAAGRVDVVRRPTGGSAVLHDRELTYSVAVPVGVLGSPRETYRALNVAIVEALRRVGVAASLAGVAGGTPPGVGAVCFRVPAEGEVIAGGGKLVGSAQRREGRTLLQHGSLLLGGSQSLVSELRAEAGADAAQSGEVTLEELLGRAPPWDRLVAAFHEGFESALGISLAPRPLSSEERRSAARHESRFRSPEWTWRM